MGELVRGPGTVVLLVELVKEHGIVVLLEE